MSVPLKVIPEFMPNRETNAIITGDVITIHKEMPNLSKVLIKSPATSKSNQGATFQIPNVSSFIDGTLEMELDLQLVLTGVTQDPLMNAAPPAGYAAVGTACYLWSPHNAGIQPGFINKLINSISFNISNKQWTETNGRADPELFDIYLSQMDQDKLNAYGIYPFEASGLVDLKKMYGNGVMRRSDLNQFAPANSKVWQKGFDTAVQKQYKHQENTLEKAVRQRYVTINSVTFATSEPNPPPIHAVLDPLYGPDVWVPKIVSTGATYYSWGVAANRYTLTQTVNITIREYLISPSLSNPWTRNPYGRSYASLGEPLNVQTTFNQQFLNSGIIALPPVLDNGSANLTSVTVTDARLNAFTFDADKSLTSDVMRTLYMYMNRENVITLTKPVSDTAGYNQTISTSNLKSLPNYLLFMVPSRIFENLSLLNHIGQGWTAGAAPNVSAIANKASLSTIAPYWFNEITNLTIQYGSQSDCVYGSLPAIKELQDLTMETLKNPKLRDVVINRMALMLANSVSDGSNNLPFFGGVGSIDPDVFFAKINATYGGLPFILVPSDSLNFRPLAGASNLPCISQFNYGSANYKSLSVTMTWKPNQLLLDTLAEYNLGNLPAVNVQYNPTVYLVTERVRSISLSGTGVMSDDIVEFDMLANKTELMEIIKKFEDENLSQSQAESTLQYIGGAWYSNLYDKIKAFARPVAKIASTLTRMGYKHPVLDTVSRVAPIFAEGKRGRPRKY